MLLVAPVLRGPSTSRIDGRRSAATMQTDPDLCERVNVVRSDHPAVTHVDYQRPAPDRGRRAESMLPPAPPGVPRRTGCPVLVNTSFNVRGEPIVCTPEDAYRCFLATDMDALVLEDYILLKGDGSPEVDLAHRQQYLAQFQLD